MHAGYIKISTFIITIIIFLILYVVSIFLVVNFYENRNVIVNVPSIVTDDNALYDEYSNLELTENE